MRLKRFIASWLILLACTINIAFGAERTLTNFTDYTVAKPDVSRTFDAVDTALSSVTGTPGTGVIVNSMVNATAAIDGSKLNLDEYITNAMVNATAAIEYSKLDLSGNITNSDIAADAGIEFSKLETLTDIDISGNVVDLTIPSEAQGDILYRNGTKWTRLGAGVSGQALVTAGASANPYWGTPNVASASALTNNVTLEAGANDYTLDLGTASGAYTLTIPAVAGSRTFSFINQAETFSAAKTFSQTGLLLQGGDTNTLNIKVNETLTGAKTLNVKVNDTDRTIDLSGDLTLGGAVSLSGALSTVGDDAVIFNTTDATEVTLPTAGTLATLTGEETFANKTFSNPKIDDTDAGLTITSADQTSGSAIATIPNITDEADTFVMNDTAATLTNKTIDADNNIVTNINANELDSTELGGTVAYGVPFVIHKKISNLSNAGSNLIQNSTFKFKIIDAHAICTSAAGDVTSWQLVQGSVGSLGTAITNAVSVANTDELVTRAGTIADDTSVIASEGDLAIIGDESGTLDIELFITAIRID